MKINNNKGWKRKVKKEGKRKGRKRRERVELIAATEGKSTENEKREAKQDSQGGRARDDQLLTKKEKPGERRGGIWEHGSKKIL